MSLPRFISARSRLSRSKLRATGVVSAIALTGALVAAACLPLSSSPATATPAPTDTALPTETIVWFPPSATPTPLAVPTYTGTPEMNPGVGAVTLTDTFSDKTLWDTAASDQASAAIGANRLTLAVQPGVYLATQRHDLVLKDFYAEITVRLSLCRGDDNYGIIVRSAGASFYRFIITCNGEVRAERISGGVRLPIHEAVQSGDARGAPAEIRIGIWAVGSEMRLFLNDRFQFNVSEKTFPSGAFGVFARAAADNPVSVTFSDLKVYDVNYSPPTRTPSP